MDDREVLGVGPGATPDEVAAAYRALARRYHPDQHPEASPAERAGWEARMAEVNAAYARLTGTATPVRRPPEPAGATGDAPTRAGPAGAVTPAAPVRPVPQPDLGRVFAAIGLAVVVLVAGVVVLLLVVSRTGGPGGGPAPTSAGSTPPTASTLAVAEWAVGNCVAGDGTLVPVPCGQPNVGRIVRAVASPSDCPAGADWWAEHALRVYCIDAA